MDTISALDTLDALSHETRLAAFRALVVAGPDGLSAGQVAADLGVLQNTMSTHLHKLQRAAVIANERCGRKVIYRANFERIRELVLFLMKDCCRGIPSVCEPIAKALQVQGE